MRFTETDVAGSASVMPDEQHLQVEINDSAHPRIAILMCTYNGAVYLRQQLDSLAEQTVTDWTLYVSDDGSTDATREVLADYQQRWGKDRLVVFDGPRKGFAENFISLIQRPAVRGDHFAFSDQDDVWFRDKLERSLSRLESVSQKVPALYCSRTRIVDASGNVIGQSPLFTRPLCFQNALVESIAGANTMLINQAARNLLLQLPDQAPLVAHDWLTYQLVTGSGGRIIYDAVPRLDYRQHGGNLIGANATLGDRLMHLRGMLSGRFVRWNDANTFILKKMCLLLTEENRETLAMFDVGRKMGLMNRVSALRKAGVYRQTRHGNLSLFLASCLGRV